VAKSVHFSCVHTHSFRISNNQYLSLKFFELYIEAAALEFHISKLS